MQDAWFDAIRRGDMTYLRTHAGRHRGTRNGSGDTGLVCAIKHNRVEAAAFLIPYERNLLLEGGTTALMVCALYNCVDVAAILAPSGHSAANSHGQTALMLAAERGHHKIVKVILPSEAMRRDGRDRTALMLAAINGHTRAIELLLAHEAGFVNREGETAFYLALYHNNVAAAHLLEPYEANVWSPRLADVIGLALSDTKTRTYVELLVQKYPNVEKAYRQFCQSGGHLDASILPLSPISERKPGNLAQPSVSPQKGMVDATPVRETRQLVILDRPRSPSHTSSHFERSPSPSRRTEPGSLPGLSPARSSRFVEDLPTLCNEIVVSFARSFGPARSGSTLTRSARRAPSRLPRELEALSARSPYADLRTSSPTTRLRTGAGTGTGTSGTPHKHSYMLEAFNRKRDRSVFHSCSTFEGDEAKEYGPGSGAFPSVKVPIVDSMESLGKYVATNMTGIPALPVSPHASPRESSGPSRSLVNAVENFTQIIDDLSNENINLARELDQERRTLRALQQASTHDKRTIDSLRQQVEKLMQNFSDATQKDIRMMRREIERLDNSLLDAKRLEIELSRMVDDADDTPRLADDTASIVCT
ncbi:Ankyrin repeat protein 1 [Giardia muris]|uniref:Ankyrin repeat protein 1 n=1 Tax=Giardia muris TaxID=5742 RepID=A0A4Z1T1A5_GIAMU|nr:Ankyrin repeat protein 1 [Giardia muris]|eukprot:TNJ27693.1 Ankyrin repeat protein 1 [Giardia muris]